MASNNIKNVNTLKIWKIHNKKHKFLFDNFYENIIDQSNKAGEDRKYFDFCFLDFEPKGYEEIIRSIVNSFENHQVISFFLNICNRV